MGSGRPGITEAKDYVGHAKLKFDGKLGVVMFPFNVDGTHWILFFVKIQYNDEKQASAELFCYDSYRTGSANAELIANMTPVLTDLIAAMPAVAPVKAPTGQTECQIWNDLKQQDLTSCGYFVLGLMDRLALGVSRLERVGQVGEYRRHVRDVVVEQMKLALGDANIQAIINEMPRSFRKRSTKPAAAPQTTYRTRSVTRRKT